MAKLMRFFYQEFFSPFAASVRILFKIMWKLAHVKPFA